MKRDFISVIATGIELGCVVALAGIGLKRNNDCYKAEMKRIDAEFERDMAEFSLLRKNAEIKVLKEQIEELKKSKEEKSEEA